MAGRKAAVWRVVAVAGSLIAWWSAAFAAERMSNCSFAAGADGWSIYSGAVDAAVSQDAEGGSIRLDFKAGAKGQAIANQRVPLNQEEPSPFEYSCWTCAEGLPEDAVPSHGNFGIELCVKYQDGSRQWVAPKLAPRVGTHGWERIAGDFTPPRAVKEVVFYARLRLAGKVWFDAFSLNEFPPPRKDLEDCRIEDKDGLITLENNYVRLTFEPAKGGTCRSFLVKATGVDYAGSRHPNARLFTDRLRVGGNSYSRAYFAEILRDTANEVALKLSLTAPQDYPFLEMSKTFRLSSRSSALECVYSYRNLPESMAAQVFEPYFRNGVAAFSCAGQHYLVPTADGTRRVGPMGGDTPFKDAVAGWIAASDGKSGALACEFDFAHLATEYFWLGGVDATTAEWQFQPVEVACGGKFETKITFWPTTGMPRLDGVENGICAAVAEGSDGRLSAELAASARYLVKATAELVPESGETRTVARTLLLSPDAPAAFALGATSKGLRMVRILVSEAGRTVFEAEHLFSKDAKIAPRKAKAKPAELKPYELKLSEDVATPHTAWMKPYAGGRPKVFFLVDLMQAREVVELAQRMELDHRVVRFAETPTTLAWGMCDRYNRFTFDDANLSLRRELERPLDAIVIAGNLWKRVDAANRATIARLAAAGVGLVEIGMDKPVIGAAKGDASGTEYVKGAIDAALLPFGADRAGAFADGKCRLVRFGYPAYGGLTPFVPYGRPEPAFRYQDYSLGIIARAVTWAAKRNVAPPPDAKETVERIVADDGREIVHRFIKDGQGRVCDWSARIGVCVAPAKRPPVREVARLVSEEERVSEMPFAVGESGYRSWCRRYLNPFRFRQYRAVGVNELRFWYNDDSPFFDEARKMGFRMDFPVAGTHLWGFTKEFSEPYAKTKDRRYLCRKPCFNDSEYLARSRETVLRHVRQFLKYGPTSFDCGDENSLTLWGTQFDFCFSEHTLAAERRWLRETYGSLDQLNASWGTSFADWGDVTPLTTAAARATHSQDRRWAAWADHRRFMELTYCGYFRMVKDAIGECAPEMPLDMSGTQPPNGYTGMDMWLLSDSIGICAAYDNDNLAEIVRSFRRPLIKPWYGYGASGPNVERRVWFDALRFKNFGVSYYTGSNVLNPDFTIPPQVKELMDALEFFRKGGAALLKTLDERPQALIHYSQASIHAAQIENRYDSFLAARATWCQLLDDLNISYRFVAYGEIEGGELARTSASVLILPESSAISSEELSAIKDFARRGGVVVGDRFTATHDIHCNLLRKGALDDLFSSYKGAVRIDRVLPQYRTLRITKGKVAEAVRYRDSIAARFAAYLPDLGVKFRSDGITGTRVFVLFPIGGGDVMYLGFVREGESNGSDGTTHVELPSARRVYDMRRQRDVGVCSGFDVKLDPYQAAFYRLSFL